jgi:hypothetical protein
MIGKAIAVACFVALTSVQAESDIVRERLGRQVQPFLSSIEQTPYDFRFYREGLLSVHAIQFQDGYRNAYETFFNRLILQSSLDDGSGRLKTMQAMTRNGFGILGHEAFHAFKANILSSRPQGQRLIAFLRARANSLYTEIPSKKREVTLEEAYATFVGWTLEGYVSVGSILHTMAEDEVADCARRLEVLESIWKSTWGAETKGYWYRDGIGEYWSDQFKAVHILITKGRKAWKEFVGRDNVHFVEQNLQTADRDWISRHLFEGRIGESFEETFATELQNLSCWH